METQVTEPNAAGVATPAAAVDQSQGGAPAGAAPAWELVVDDQTKYTDPAKARESFLDARKQIGEHKTWQEKLSEFNIAYEDGRTVKASEDVDGFLRLVNDLLNPKPAASSVVPDGKLDISQLSPEYQQHIDILKRAGLFAQADQFTKVSDELNTIKQQLQGFTAQQSSSEKARIDTAVAEGRTLLGEVAKEAGFQLDDKALKMLSDAVETQIVDASRDKDNRLVAGSPEDRYFRGDRAARTAIVKEQFAAWQNIADGYASNKNANYAQRKTGAMANQPKPLGAGAGSGIPTAGGKRPTESERAASLRAILSQGAVE